MFSFSISWYIFLIIYLMVRTIAIEIQFPAISLSRILFHRRKNAAHFYIIAKIFFVISADDFSAFYFPAFSHYKSCPDCCVYINIFQYHWWVCKREFQIYVSSHNARSAFLYICTGRNLLSQLADTIYEHIAGWD